MRCITRLTIAFIFAAAAGGAIAHDYHAGDIRITHPWARATTTEVTAVYLKIANKGVEADRLLRVMTDIGRAEIHESKTEGGVAKMRHVDALVIPSKREVSLQPGGMHIMFMDLKKPLTEGFGIPMTLVFEKAGEVHIDVLVQKAGAKSMEH